MIDLVKKFFGKTIGSGQGDQVEATSHDIRIATCALLLEMANIDGEFNESERKSILAILKEVYQLSDEYAEELIKISKEELQGSVDLWQFTNLINRNYSIEEKNELSKWSGKLPIRTGSWISMKIISCTNWPSCYISPTNSSLRPNLKSCMVILSPRPMNEGLSRGNISLVRNKEGPSPPVSHQTPHVPPYPIVTFSPCTITGTLRTPPEYSSISSSPSLSTFTSTYRASSP